MLKREGEIDRNEEEKRKEKITKAPTDSADSFLLGGRRITYAQTGR
jgi:hypothetical protein